MAHRRSRRSRSAAIRVRPTHIQVGGKNAATGTVHLNASSLPDTDGDGFSDARETALGENPNVACAIMRADVNDSTLVNSTDLLAVALIFGPNRVREDRTTTQS